MMQNHISEQFTFLLEAASINEIGKKITILSGAFTPNA